jgi:hypothetical protein
MDKKFLHKVLDQIVNETEIDHDEGRIYSPFKPHFLIQFFFLLSTFTLFSRHCEEVYGLNDDEVRYVWNEYKTIIKDKING